LEETLEMILPTGHERKVTVSIKKGENLLNVFIRLANNENEFFKKFIEKGGMSDEGPFVVICNNKIIKYEQIRFFTPNPGDKIYFIQPILGG
jgi:hypothetical protein